jgi:hypothetical protein
MSFLLQNPQQGARLESDGKLTADWHNSEEVGPMIYISEYFLRQSDHPIKNYIWNEAKGYWACLFSQRVRQYEATGGQSLPFTGKCPMALEDR